MNPPLSISSIAPTSGRRWWDTGNVRATSGGIALPWRLAWEGPFRRARCRQKSKDLLAHPPDYRSAAGRRDARPLRHQGRCCKQPANHPVCDALARHRHPDDCITAHRKAWPGIQWGADHAAAVVYADARPATACRAGTSRATTCPTPVDMVGKSRLWDPVGPSPRPFRRRAGMIPRTAPNNSRLLRPSAKPRRVGYTRGSA